MNFNPEVSVQRRCQQKRSNRWRNRNLGGAWGTSEGSRRKLGVCGAVAAKGAGGLPA